MQSQEVQHTLIDEQNLALFMAEIEQEIYNSLDKDKLLPVLEKYGLTKEESLPLQFVIDINQMKSGEANNQPQGLLPGTTPPKVVRLRCYYQNGQWYGCTLP